MDSDLSMKILNKKEFLKRKEFYLEEIKKGKIFIYPTDTIYGIGCIATNPKSILKIRKIKKRDEKPFSIIVPSKQWILENCDVAGKEECLKKLPGPYTLILKLKSKKVISKKETIGDLDTVGVRMPNHWFSEFLSNNRLLFLTTSVNTSGEPHLTKIKDLKEDLIKGADYAIDEGILNRKPSMIINLSQEKTKTIKRE